MITSLIPIKSSSNLKLKRTHENSTVSIFSKTTKYELKAMLLNLRILSMLVKDEKSGFSSKWMQLAAPRLSLKIFVEF